MNPLLLVGGGAAIAYLIVRARDAAAASKPRASADAPAPPSSQPPAITVPSRPQPGEIAPARPTTIPMLGRWGWPVPRYEGRAPVISDGYGSARPPAKHLGVDLMFGRISSDPFPIGPNGSKAFVMPDAWMAVSASDGVLWSAGYSPRGYSVVIDHGPVATFYQHLDALFVPEINAPAKGAPRDKLIPIKAGQPLGVIGGDPLDPGHLKHLHFELWPGGPHTAIDPAPLMKTWDVFGPSDVAPFLDALHHRNASRKNKERKRGDLVPVRGYERRYPNSSLHWLP